ncbi:MAG TPA: amidase [Xanthobacteraceae bacterium]|jgi:aspartyl-tRNA(Asn)/glutamyl-tRNA(Gln) amidotransferase subunit A|nr:amidase [Xanthobacteraceae bacterium]
MTTTSVRDRLEQALARIADPNGEGKRVCLSVYAETARAAADAADRRAGQGQSLGPLDGTIVSIKDLFDVAGEPTRAGSKILSEEALPAAADAPVVQRLRAGGAVIIAKTNMSEFAFTGLGANPHFGTPRNPRDRSRVPGGSSSGAPVAVADGMCEISIGTDTGGSVRIPAALCGMVGLKPSRQRIPTQGAFPLSKTLDSIGPIAKTVSDCAKADAVMAGEEFKPLELLPLAGLRFGIAEGLPFDGVDTTVAAAFDAAVAKIEAAGGKISREKLPLFDDMNAVNAKGGISPAEACMLHRDRLARRAGDVDPNVRPRIERGCAVTPEVYQEMVRERLALMRAMDERLSSLDILLMPTTPIVAPTIAEVEDRAVFAGRNAMMLRNTGIGNFFDLCAVTLPLPATLPVGLMLIARNGQDHRLLRIAAAAEKPLTA